MTQTAYDGAVAKLKRVLQWASEADEDYRHIIRSRDAALARYRPVFLRSHLPDLTPDELSGFLRYTNNCHWTNLARRGDGMLADMPRTRAGIDELLDDATPIEDRINQALPKVSGLGHNIATAILLVAHPDKYGVWNGTSAKALKDKLGLWPSSPHGEGKGGRYVALNRLFKRLAKDISLDLWALDALFWSVHKYAPATGFDAGRTGQGAIGAAFGALRGHIAG